MSRRILCDVSSARGAPMGRIHTVEDRNEAIKFRLYRMRIDSGGYDEGGAYWGTGNERIGHMYHAYGDGPENSGEVFVRAKDRNEAKTKVKEYFPNAKFFK